MYLHPNGIGFNGYKALPELFQDNNIDFMHFCIALGFQSPERTNDYFMSGEIMFASLGTKDINLLFSGVQRLNGYEHKDFQSYLQSKKVRCNFLNITSDNKLQNKIQELTKIYNAKYGMSRQINDFYLKYLDNTSKSLLISKIGIPSDYYGNFSGDINDNVKYRIDFLLKIRNSLDHAAMYHPLSLGGTQPEHIRVKKGKREYIFLVWLTFEELYEISRIATARYWLEHYMKIVSGNSEKIDTIVNKIRSDNKRINEEKISTD